MNQPRRDFLRSGARWLGLGVLLSGAAALVLRRPRAADGQTCVNTGLCRGCRAYDACGLPTALSMKAALRPGAQP